MNDEKRIVDPGMDADPDAGPGTDMPAKTEQEEKTNG